MCLNDDGVYGKVQCYWLVDGGLLFFVVCVVGTVNKPNHTFNLGILMHVAFYITPIMYT